MNASINPQAKLLRYPDKLAAWRAGTPFAPIGVEIDLTNRCNLGCEFCHFGYTHSRGLLSKQQRAEFEQMGDEMSDTLAYLILRALHENGVKSVTFSGGGEPTLHPHFREIVLRAAQLGFKLGLYTNGTRLDTELANFVKQHFEWTVVSLDADNAEDYQRMKKVDAFGKACVGIRNLKEAVGNCKVGVSFLIDADNFQHTWRMIELNHKLGGDYAEFRPIVHFDLDAPDKASEDTSWISFALPHLKEIHQRKDVHVALDKFERLFRWKRGYITCHANLFTSVITPNGKMWTCVNRRGFPNSCIGDLTQESFASIWKRQTAFTVDKQCRVLCRADALNITLNELATPIAHEEFI